MGAAGTVEKVAVGIVAIGMATTILLRAEGFAKAVDSLNRLFTGSLRVSIQGK